MDNSYPHHMGHTHVAYDKYTTLVAQDDAATWYWTAMYNRDVYRHECNRDNAVNCQEYAARASRAARVALGIE